MRPPDPPFSRLLLTALAVVLLSCSSAFADQYSFIRAKDGDSLLLDRNGNRVEVRLIGVDAPEWKQEWGREAWAFASGFCTGRTIRLEFDKKRRDKYGRLLAYVYADGKLLNKALLEQGFAITIAIRPNVSRYAQFKKAMQRARKAKSGFWRYGGLKLTPHQWRKKNRKR